MQDTQLDAIWINAQIVTCDEEHSIIPNGAIAVKDDTIAWIAEMSQLPSDLPKTITHDVNGACLTPGLIDCHTHLVFGGNRAHEFEMRLNGMTYAEIAKNGGGIQSTVNATRHLSEDELLQQSLPRAKALMQSGVTTVEIKSGYGLDLDNEIKMLTVAKKIGEILPLNVYKTFLGAHTIPKEFTNRADDYIEYICNDMLPMIAERKLADAVDVFCETIAFNLQQTEKIFLTAEKYQLDIKCHAEQLSNSGSAELAARYHAVSVDHLEYISKKGIEAIAKSGTVAVLLPGAFYFLREKQLPPIQLLREHNVPIAIATDCNPGTSPLISMQIAMNMASVLFQMTPKETLIAATKNGAHALKMQNRGVLKAGNKADFAIWEIKDPNELSYSLGLLKPKYLINNGKNCQLYS